MKSITIELPNKERLMMIKVELNAERFRIVEPLGNKMLIYKVLDDVGTIPIPSTNEYELLGTYSPQSGIDFPEEVKEEWTGYSEFESSARSSVEKLEILLYRETEKQWPLKQAESLIAWMEEGKEIQSNIGGNESKVMPSRFICLLIRN